METCFVMQPFDGDVYDKRYEDVFAPAIREAGLDPYRVDKDAGVSVPINEIETGIKNSRICFAEITTDNPNVWFELGFAIAAEKEVVIVCSEDRKSHFPFDVQHRSIIKYRCGAPQDFTELKGKITRRLVAVLKKESEISRASSISPVKDTEGLAPHEIVCLVAVVENAAVDGTPVSADRIKNDMNKAGFTGIAFALAAKVLAEKNMIVRQAGEDHNGNWCVFFEPHRNGEDWLLANQNLLVLEKPPLPF